MPSRIEDYALLGDCRSAALVAGDGSIDWLCCPRFDSGACFAALLGTPDNGRWQITPTAQVRQVRRRYRPGTLVLETEFETDSGTVTLVDCMPPFGDGTVLVRQVEGKRGQVPMHMEWVVRFDYGRVVPWVRREEGGIRAIAGPSLLHLRTDVDMHGEGRKTEADFVVSEGQQVPLVQTWHESYLPEPDRAKAEDLIRRTDEWWQKWSSQCTYKGEWREEVLRSLITLKALTYAPSGGIAAAATTSLPEQLGGVRNWDYRYCWLRDSTFTLLALMGAGFEDEAKAWREWLLRAVAGDPKELQIMYGLAGERRLDEWEVPWLPGYEGAHPVRVGNAASNQFQLDVYGETLDSLYQCRRSGLPPDEPAWHLEKVILDFLETAWEKPDNGIWEVRGPRRHFTHSKVMAWVAFDRAVKGVEKFKLDGPAERWRSLRDRIHEEVCQQGFNSKLGAFVQYYGADLLDASLLMIPLVGFLPPTDPRVRGTVEAIERHLLRDGFVARYPTRKETDGLPPGEGEFLACTFWLADNLVMMGRRDEARSYFERLLAIRNDVGLLSEEYDPRARRQVGNFPQAFSHVGLVNTARNFSEAQGPAEHRGKS